MGTRRCRMPFRKTVTALLTAVLAVSLLQAVPATATPAPKPHAKTAKAAEAVEACGAALTWHTVVACAEPAAETVDSYPLPTIDATDQVAIVLTTAVDGAWLSGRLRGPGGAVACYAYPGDVPKVCNVQPGNYTLDVESNSEPSPYTVSVVSVRTATCAPLSAGDLSPASAGRSGELAIEMAADCYQFDGAAGDVVRLGAGAERVYLYDADTELVCQAQPGTRCDLTGSGPYRALVLRPRANETTYTLRLAKLNASVGCDTMSAAPFGAPGAATVTGTLAAEATTCRSVALADGLVWLRSAWKPSTERLSKVELYNGAGELVCTDARDVDCRISAAGVHTILFDNSANDAAATYSFAAVGRGDGTGCMPTVGTSWDLPLISVTPASVLQVDCQPIDAAAGDRMKIESSAGQGVVRVLDANDLTACELPWSETECTLSGTAPFRIVVTAGVPHQLEIGRLSNAAGCTPLTMTKFGQVGAVAPEGSRCRELTVGTAATYVIDSGVEQGDEATSGKPAYGVDGKPACTRLVRCVLQPGRYVILVPSSAHIATFPVTATDGCTTQAADDFVPKRGRLADTSQFDCLTLTAPAGAVLKPLEPADQAKTSGVVLDANGTELCSWGRDVPACALTGTAPFRAVIESGEFALPGPYALAFPRVDPPARCAALPQGDFTAPGGSTVALNPERFATCLQIPAAAHAATEAVQYSRTAGTGLAALEVLDAAGGSACDSPQKVAAYEFCRLTKDQTYSALLVGTDTTSTYQVARRDITGGAKGCGAVGSTTVGSTAATATVDKNLLRCHKVTGAATDRFVFNVRDKNSSTGFVVADAAGELGCSSWDLTMCQAAGSTSYQVVTWNDDTVAPATAYKLEAFRIATAAGPAPECTRVANSGYGFGPLTGELNTSRTAACVVFPMGARRQLNGSAVNQVSSGPAPLFRDYGPGGESNCMWAGEPSGEFYCTGSDSPSWTETGLLWLPEKPVVSALKYTTSATCPQPLCGGATFGVSSVTPASAAAGGPATVTVKGKSLHVKDVVRFKAIGKPDLAGVVKSVSVDRTAATVVVDLKGAALGARDLVVESFAGGSGTAANAFTVTAAALVNTQAPALVAPVRVGAAVKVSVGTWSPAATSYTYQWRDNGAAIRGAGAATYTPAAAMLGHKLSVTVTAARAGYASKAVTTAAVAVATGLAPKATKGPVATGTYKVGKTVTSTAGTWAPACTAARFQWYSAGKAVAGGTKASLVLTKAMGAKALYVAVTCARSGHASGVASTRPVTVAV
ncbi:hypothetical protein ABZS29_00415 [Kribbella sp. NPDC005582]|uniref:hypothetical protein n=1 Tax=Kribbella sp. NPDC005582 TaxID=3156893 RepID=UPI0033BE2938